MKLFLTLILIAHIAAGFTALFTGLIAIWAVKGGKTHILSGRIYYYAMVLVAITAVLLAVFKSLTFLFSIAVFSFYLTFTGYRSVKYKSGDAKLLDWLVLSMVFRSKNSSEKAWLYRHIGKMSGAYIATVTAFLVTNIHFLPSTIVWLAPTVIGTPLIAYTIRKYKMKFAL